MILLRKYFYNVGSEVERNPSCNTTYIPVWTVSTMYSDNISCIVYGRVSFVSTTPDSTKLLRSKTLSVKPRAYILAHTNHTEHFAAPSTTLYINPNELAITINYQPFLLTLNSCILHWYNISFIKVFRLLILSTLFQQRKFHLASIENNIR